MEQKEMNRKQKASLHRQDIKADPLRAQLVILLVQEFVHQDDLLGELFVTIGLSGIHF